MIDPKHYSDECEFSKNTERDKALGTASNRPGAGFYDGTGQKRSEYRLEKGDALYKLDARGLPIRRLIIDKVTNETAYSGEHAILRLMHPNGFFIFYGERLYRETDERRRIFTARRIATAANKAAKEGDDKLLEEALFLLTGEG